ncbi:flagellar biosynthetic protein FliR [Pacificimonas sp. WHA3]|uniref:Flagellar biosynthetic protein FliR n=1 Tax=Pacificimonas pallii TaxID=2827236 RepID=A0ABS6SGE8_9SPHN|nr:flagellar biosynthetic protein FliR [Pacificimonas pallii]MBV7256991.1 flagellar biosynthetic protein FliR [Pacificimonas pallii]
MIFPTGDIEAPFILLLTAMLRVGGAFIIAPIFSAMGLPLMVRILLAAAIAFTVMQMTPIEVNVDPLSFAMLAIAVQEILLGLSMGFVLQVAFAAPILAGDYIANSMGLGFASAINPQGGVQVPVLGNFLLIVTSLIFLGSGGHLIFIETLMLSYERLPIGGDWLSADMMVNVAAFGGIMFRVGLMIALPVGFALFSVNVIIGFVTRSAPQLNIFAVGIPATLLIGMVMLAMTFPAITPMIEGVVDDGLTEVRRIAFGETGR